MILETYQLEKYKAAMDEMIIEASKIILFMATWFISVSIRR